MLNNHFSAIIMSILKYAIEVEKQNYYANFIIQETFKFHSVERFCG